MIDKVSRAQSKGKLRRYELSRWGRMHGWVLAAGINGTRAQNALCQEISLSFQRRVSG
jgi:hypothetical protein